MNTLTDAERALFDALRDRGFAVVAFTPDELGTADPNSVESFMIQYGWDFIDMNQIAGDDNEP